MNEQKTIRLLAEFMDGISRMAGVDAPTIIEQAERACKRARVDEHLVTKACQFLATQNRI